MKQLFRKILIASNILMIASACTKSENSSVIPISVISDTFNIYPIPTAPKDNNSSGYAGWVGDVMPYYNNGKFQLFFLHDAPNRVKQSSAGQHPIHSFTTNNLLDFTYESEAISYGNINTQDYLLGTGSMIKVGSTNYFYYTGNNGSSNWLQNNNPGWSGGNSREAIMYATSSDFKSWTKKAGFALNSPDGFSRNDFRDPFVFYNEEFNEYWMLVSGQQSGKGVLLVFKTNTPAADNWQLRGTLNVEGDYSMLECADIFKWGSQYYMLFAEDWSGTPGTHYRVANSTAGPWLKPAGGNDMFDGHQFYAGRMASNGTEYYTFGWAHRRSPENDNGTRTWAGNLISHELVKLNNGGLGVRTPASVLNYFNKPANLVIKSQDGTVNQSSSNYTIDGSASSAGYKFSEFQSSVKVNGNISFSNSTGSASIGFNAGTVNNGTYVIRFEPETNRIAAYNYGSEITRVPFKFEVGKMYSFNLIIDNSIAVLYFNNEVALTNRVYGMKNKVWSLRANNTKVTVNDLKVLTH